MTSAAEAETITVFNNGKADIPIIVTAGELGHPQNGATFKTDNSTCDGILNATMRQKRSKHYDMKIWWFRDQIKKGLFRLFWEKGCLNLADYFTKHHPPISSQINETKNTSNRITNRLTVYNHSCKGVFLPGGTG